METHHPVITPQNLESTSEEASNNNTSDSSHQHHQQHHHHEIKKVNFQISNSNATIHIHKDLLWRLHNHFIMLSSPSSENYINSKQVHVLLFGNRSQTYQNKSIHIESYRVVYSDEMLNDYFTRHCDENQLELLGFAVFSTDEYYNFSKLKSTFQTFHNLVLSNYLVQYQSSGINVNYKAALERYVGLLVRYCVQDQIYSGEDEVFVQLLSYNTRIYSPYLENNYVETIVGNVLLGCNEAVECNCKFRQDLNLSITTGQLSQFVNQVKNISFCNNTISTSNNSPIGTNNGNTTIQTVNGNTTPSADTINNVPSDIHQCMNEVFYKSNTIPYLEEWMRSQLDNQSSDLIKLVKEYEQLEKENQLLREELDFINLEE